MSDLHLEGAKVKDVEKLLDCRYYFAQANPEKELSYYLGAIDALTTAGFLIKQDENHKNTVKEVF